jgi:hypothetical protein
LRDCINEMNRIFRRVAENKQNMKEFLI